MATTVRELLLLGGVLYTLSFHVAWSQESEPFHTRNLTPLVSIFGLPTWGSDAAQHEFGVTSELANHYQSSQGGDEALILDGETWRIGLRYSHKLNRKWSLGLELPIYQHSGGILDDVIDAWHSIFNMPDGGRNNRAEDELQFTLIDENQPFLNLNQRSSGFGDFQISVNRRLGDDGRFILSAALKLPTGDESILAGSGSTDWSFTVMRPAEVSFRDRPAGYFWGVGAVLVGDATRIAYTKEDLVYVGILGGSWKILPRMGAKAQIDVHTAFYDTPLEEIGQTSVQLTLGGWREIGDRGVLEFAVNEDLQVSTAPDVVVHLGIRWGW